MSDKAPPRVRVNLFMSEKLHGRVRVQARESGVSVTEFIRVAIAQACDTAEANEARRLRNSTMREKARTS